MTRERKNWLRNAKKNKQDKKLNINLYKNKITHIVSISSVTEKIT